MMTDLEHGTEATVEKYIGFHHNILNVIFFMKVPPMASHNENKKRIFTVELLIVLFGISSWVAVNGLWVELPVLVHSLPESWQLASYVVIITQIANLGPILFSVARKIWTQKVLEVPLIHASLFIVIIACVLLCPFWDVRTRIFGGIHSTAFFILTFFIALVDCTSSLLFLSFIANFKEQYVGSYLLGSGLSSPLPGLVALVQGIGGNPLCNNISLSNSTGQDSYTLEPYYPPPRFSASVFFGIVCVQMIISWIAFILLNYLPKVKDERVQFSTTPPPSNSGISENFQSSIEVDFSTSLEKSIPSEKLYLLSPKLTTEQYYTLLSIQGFNSLIYNGLLLSIQTYSCLPYGNLAYHLTATLSSISNPICCFVAMIRPISSVGSICLLTVYMSAWAGYILATALLSPTPPMIEAPIGGYIVIIAWIMVSGTLAYSKACIASIMRKDGGQTGLYHCGIVQQIGSAAGALTIFLLLQFTTLFKSYTPCT